MTRRKGELQRLRAQIAAAAKRRGVEHTAKARQAARVFRVVRAEVQAADLAPTVHELQAAGITSLRGIAAALNERGIPTASGRGTWQAVQVSRVLARLVAA